MNVFNDKSFSGLSKLIWLLRQPYPFTSIIKIHVSRKYLLHFRASTSGRHSPGVDGKTLNTTSNFANKYSPAEVTAVHRQRSRFWLDCEFSGAQTRFTASGYRTVTFLFLSVSPVTILYASPSASLSASLSESVCVAVYISRSLWISVNLCLRPCLHLYLHHSLYCCLRGSSRSHDGTPLSSCANNPALKRMCVCWNKQSIQQT